MVNNEDVHRKTKALGDAIAEFQEMVNSVDEETKSKMTPDQRAQFESGKRDFNKLGSEFGSLIGDLINLKSKIPT